MYELLYLRTISQFSHSVMSSFLWPHGLQHARISCLSPTPWACSNSCPLSPWCHPTISYSVIPLSSCLQSFSTSGSFPVSQFFCMRWPKYWSFSFSISPSNEFFFWFLFLFFPFIFIIYMEFRKMVMITLYAKQKKRHRCTEQNFGLCGRRWGWDVSKEQHWNIHII